MIKMTGVHLLAMLIAMFTSSCSKNSTDELSKEKKIFTSSFESVDDFAGFYITPQAHKGTTFHELSEAVVHSGSYAHKAWINGTNEPSITQNNNHRGYPSIQLQKTEAGTFLTPAYITLWVWLDMELQASTNGDVNDWFSFATFTDDETDNWDRTILVNLSYDGNVHLQNVPSQDQQTHIFQNTSLKFPQKEWVELKVYLDFGENGYAKVWQNGELVSHANLDNIGNKLSQMHFGMYAPPQIASGIVYNDDLKIVEVDEE